MRNYYIRGLILQDIDTTAAQVALWEEVVLWKTAFRKIRNWKTFANKSIKDIDSKRDRIKKKYAPNPLKIKSRLHHHILSHLNLNQPYISTTRELDELGDLIINKTMDIQKNVSSGDFKGSTIDELITYTIQKMFSDMSERFKNSSKEDQDAIINEILNGLDEMPAGLKMKLQEVLELNNISEGSIRIAVATGTLGAAFAVLIEVAGFSAYVFAVKALAAIAGVVGITLPFGVYITATSLIAASSSYLVSTPLFIVLCILMVKWSNRKIRNALLPMLITQIAVAGHKGTVGGDGVKEALEILRMEKHI